MAGVVKACLRAGRTLMLSFIFILSIESFWVRIAPDAMKIPPTLVRNSRHLLNGLCCFGEEDDLRYLRVQLRTSG